MKEDVMKEVTERGIWENILWAVVGIFLCLMAIGIGAVLEGMVITGLMHVNPTSSATLILCGGLGGGAVGLGVQGVETCLHTIGVQWRVRRHRQGVC